MPPSPPALVWPQRTWALAALTEAQYATWERDGYLVVPGALRPALAAAAAAAIREFVGASLDDDPETAYRNVLDIYEDRAPSGRRPAHGPCGMVQMYHHAALWAIRQDPRLHRRAHPWSLRAALGPGPPPQRLIQPHAPQHLRRSVRIALPVRDRRSRALQAGAEYFASRVVEPRRGAGPRAPTRAARSPHLSSCHAFASSQVHSGLHWDVATGHDAWPVPFSVQGVVYLEETRRTQGAMRVVPGFHRRFGAWANAQPENRSLERADELDELAVLVSGGAGDLVVWHPLLPHGPSANDPGQPPRVSAYVAYLPVDASPFLPPGSRADAPLSMPDAGTLDYHDGAKRASLRRLTREQRAARWRERRPMLAEDPREDEIEMIAPTWRHGGKAPPCALSPLGERLAGVSAWPAGSCALLPRRDGKCAAAGEDE